MATPVVNEKATESSPFDFTNIKKWIALQEAKQNESGRPVSLTLAQLKALRELDLAALAAFAPPLEPKSDKNWVGLLHMYRDAHPTGRAVEFIEEYRGVDPRGGGNLWGSFTTLPEAGGRKFPSLNDGVGVGAEGSPNSFAKKKDAKQYAARCAVEWLRQQQLMPSDGDGVVFKRPRTQDSNGSWETSGVVERIFTAAATADTNTAPTTAPTTVIATTFASQATRSSLQSTTVPSVADPGSKTQKVEDKAVNGPSYVTRVEQLCTSLGYGKPIYVLEPIEHARLFSGWADWRDETRVPSSIGVVKDILGKKHAKEKIAEQIHDHLAQVEAKRKERTKAIMDMCKKTISGNQA